MKLIVGLGNPGRKYKSTKHNIGFMCLDGYAKASSLKFSKERKFYGEFIKNGSTLLLKPHTFMNNSGQSIKAVMDFYQISSDDVLIIYDDLALPFGKLRLREKGSSGGHNGVKSIINHLKTQEVKRVRIGIDENSMIDTKDYVLSKFSKKELKEIVNITDNVNRIIDDFSQGYEFTRIMNKYN